MFGNINAVQVLGFPFTKILFFGIFFTAPFRDARFIDFLSIQDILIITRLTVLLLSVANTKSISGSNFLIFGTFFFIFCVLQSFLIAVEPSESSINSLKFVLTFFLIIVRDFFSLQIGRLLRVTTFCLLSLVAFWNLDVFAYSRTRLFQSLNPSTGFSTNAVSGTSTLEARIFSVKYGWERILDSPIFGNGMDDSGRITDLNLEPHNFFVIGWQSGGLLVLSALIIFSAFSFKALLSALLRNEFPKIIIILVTWLALLTSPLLYERSVITPLILVICTFLVESKKIRTDSFYNL